MDVIGWCLAIVSTTILMIFWFYGAHKELDYAKHCVENAYSQLTLHQQSSKSIDLDIYMVAANHSMETVEMIYDEVVKNYENVRNKPLNRLPARIMGFGSLTKGK